MSRLLLPVISSWLLVSAAPLLAVPDFETLRGLRSARISHLEGDHAAELATLDALGEASPEDLSVVYEQISYAWSHEVPRATLEEATRRWHARLASKDAELSSDVASLIVQDPDADPETLRLLATRLEARAGEDDTDRVLESLVLLYSRLGDAEGRIATLERLVSDDPTILERLGLLAAYREAGEWKKCRDLIAGWLAEEPSPSLRGLYVDVLSRLGEVDELRRQVDLLVESRSGAGPTASPGLGVVLRAAWNLRDAGQDAAAEELFRKVVGASPDDEEARTALLYLYGSEEELARLQAAQEEKLRQTEDPQVLLDRGTERLAAGDAEAAFELLERAAPAFPKLEPAWYNLGMAAYRLERWEVVDEAFAKASELNPERGQNYYFRGLALEKLERCEETVVALEKALELEPERTLAHYFLGSCYRRLGNAEAAAKHLELYEASKE